MKTMKSSFFLFSLFLFTGNISAQYDANAQQYGQTRAERSEAAIQAIESIKKGVLVFRLSSEVKKINEIDKLIEKAEADGTKKSRLEKLRSKTIKEAEEMNHGLYDAFENNFEFADVLFVYDTSIHNLYSGVQSGYFLNKDLEVDPEINLDNRTFRVARFGWPFNKGSVYKNIYVMDENNNDLARPFPNGVRTREWLVSIIRGGAFTNIWKYYVRNFEKKIKRFYYLAVSKGYIED